MAHTITINGRDGDFSGYLAQPAKARGAGIVVIQEIFGVNAAMRRVADRFAEQGFFALVPDLFWRLEPGVELSDKTDAEWQKAFDLMNRFDQNKGVEDVQASIDHLRVTAGVSAKIGAVGYCLGGLLTYLAASRTDSDASVSYYGVNIQEKLSEQSRIHTPLMLHIAGGDEYVPPEAQSKIVEGLKANPQVTIHVYPGVNHAFARPGGKNYNAASAEVANARTDSFFRRYLS